MRRHSPDIVSLVFGVAFVGFAAVGLASSLFGASVSATWVVPLLLLTIGAAGLLGSLSRLGREAGTPRGDRPRR